MKLGKKSIVRKGLTVGAAAVASAVFASLAPAATVNLGDKLSISSLGVNGWGSSWASHTPQATVNYKTIGHAGPGGSATSGTGVAAYAGQIDWSGTDTTPTPNEALDFITYCVQLTTDVAVPSGPYNYTVTTLASTADLGENGLSGSTTALDIAALMAANQGMLTAASPAPALGSSASNAYAAFQVAIWDLVYNDGAKGDFNGSTFNVSAGTYFNVANSTIATMANADLNSIVLGGAINTSGVTAGLNGGYLINGGTYKGDVIYGISSASGTVQNQGIVVVPPPGSGGGLPTPLPKSFAALIGLLGLTGLVNWRRKQFA